MRKLATGLLVLSFIFGVNAFAAGVFLAFGKALQWIWPAGAENPLVVLTVGIAALACAIGVTLYGVRAIGWPRRSRGRAPG